jgi:hypothetical protein
MIAVTRGHTGICAYLRTEHCAWDEAACNEAALNGHGSTLRWLRENGCPWQTDTMHLLAARGGSVDAMEFLQQQGIVFCDVMLANMLNAAGASDKLAAAKWLREQGAEWPAQLYWHREWSVDAVAWARAEGCTSAAVETDG